MLAFAVVALSERAAAPTSRLGLSIGPKYVLLLSLSSGPTKFPDRVHLFFRFLSKKCRKNSSRGFEVCTPRGRTPVAASRASEERFRRKVSVEISLLTSSVPAAPTRRRRLCRSRRRFRSGYRDASTAACRSLGAFSVGRVSAAKLSPGTLFSCCHKCSVLVVEVSFWFLPTC